MIKKEIAWLKELGKFLQIKKKFPCVLREQEKSFLNNTILPIVFDCKSDYEINHTKTYWKIEDYYIQNIFPFLYKFTDNYYLFFNKNDSLITEYLIDSDNLSAFILQLECIEEFKQNLIVNLFDI